MRFQIEKTRTTNEQMLHANNIKTNKGRVAKRAWVNAKIYTNDRNRQGQKACTKAKRRPNQDKDRTRQNNTDLDIQIPRQKTETKEDKGER